MQDNKVDVSFWVDVDVTIKQEDIADLFALIKPSSISMYLHADGMDDLHVDCRKDLGNDSVLIELTGDIMQEVSISDHDLAEIESCDSVSIDVLAEVVFAANLLQTRLEKLFREGPIATRNSRVHVSEPDEDELIDELTDQVYYR
jgi:hypothetical protein